MSIVTLEILSPAVVIANDALFGVLLNLSLKLPLLRPSLVMCPKYKGLDWISIVVEWMAAKIATRIWPLQKKGSLE